MKVAVIDYSAGNIRSVLFALERLGVEGVLTQDKETIQQADKVVFPGVGEASSSMAHLHKMELTQIIPALKQPMLGICIGLQLMCQHSEEGDSTCLGIFDTKVRKFRGKEKIPHIGWNNVYSLQSPLFEGVNENTYMYFLHSYFAEKSEYTSATSEYMIKYSAAIEKDNFYAVQFHPEKSGSEGQKIISNFLNL